MQRVYSYIASRKDQTCPTCTAKLAILDSCNCFISMIIVDVAKPFSSYAVNNNTVGKIITEQPQDNGACNFLLKI